MTDTSVMRQIKKTATFFSTYFTRSLVRQSFINLLFIFDFILIN